MSDVWDAHMAARYDDLSDPMWSKSVLGPTVDRLEELAEGRSVLELAIGTGRVALLLHQRGVAVSGIELSPAMVDVLRSKPGGAEIPVAIGDMAAMRIDGEFGLVYLVYNTITNLVSQESQVDCFCNAAAHLAPGGYFVVETFVPELRRLPPGETLVPFDVSPTHVGIDEYDVVHQRLVSHHVLIRGGAAEVTAGHFRYAWPAELDLMARIAGLELRWRWAGWDRAPFTADSRSHVSVWSKPAA